MLAGIVCAIGICGCAGETAPLDKAGGSHGPLVLRLAVADGPASPSGVLAAVYARAVSRLSHGTIEVRPVWSAETDLDGALVAGSDQLLARELRRGAFDLGIVASGAWSRLGVSSFRALQVPFEIESNDALRRISADAAVTAPALRGLARIGIVGLGITPEGLQFPLGIGRPLRSAADYRMMRFREADSAETWSVLHALGVARPTDVSGDAFTKGAYDFSIHGASVSLPVGLMPRFGGVTGNVVLFAKFDVIAANAARFRTLDHVQRETLIAAARLASRSAGQALVSPASGARAYCASTGTVLLASAADRQALVATVGPFLTVLRSDRTTSTQLDRIRTIARSFPSRDPVRACTSRSRASSGSGRPLRPGNGDQTALDGVYRVELTIADLLARGFSRADASRLAGVWTMALARGQRVSRRNGSGVASRGPFAIDGDTVTFSLLAPSVIEPILISPTPFRFSRDGEGTLRLTPLVVPRIGETERSLQVAVLASRPWSLTR